MSEFIVNRHCGDPQCKFISITVDPEFISQNVGVVSTDDNEVISMMRLNDDERSRIEAASTFVQGVRMVHGY